MMNTCSHYSECDWCESDCVTSCNELTVNFNFLLHFNCLSFCFSFLESQFNFTWFTFAQNEKNFLLSWRRTFSREGKNFKDQFRKTFRGRDVKRKIFPSSKSDTSEAKAYQLQANYSERAVINFVLCSVLREKTIF